MIPGGTNLPRVGGYNQTVVLDAIRARGPISRVELVPLTGLTAQTISNVVRRLLNEGLVEESGHSYSDGGKRRTLLSMRACGAYAVGVHLDPDFVVVALVNLAGEVVRSRRIRLFGPVDPADLVEQVTRTVKRLVRDAAVDPVRVLGAGIATPGPIDGARGAIVDPPNFLGWGQVPLAKMFGEATGMPVAMDKDATAAAIGERWIGGAERSGSFLFIYIGTGIGGGVSLDSAILHGESGNAGEFGHIVVEPGGRSCSCGGTGCLETYCSPAAILADLSQRHGEQTVSRLGLTATPESLHSDWTLLRQAVRQGDPAATDTVRQAARRIGQASRSAVNLLDVGRIILGGEAVKGIEPILSEEIDAAVNGASIARVVRRVRIEPSLIGDTVGAVGAASLVLHGNYAPGWQQLTEAPR
ncbi:ROK family protein [Streptomyces sp. NPDC055722]